MTPTATAPDRPEPARREPAELVGRTTPPVTPTYVVGHKNPDADAICSAIAYAALKEARGERGYIAARCGNSNVRIDTILARFHQPLPHYLSDVSPRVHDLMTPGVISVTENATCAEALHLLDEHHITVLHLLHRGFSLYANLGELLQVVQ